MTRKEAAGVIKFEKACVLRQDTSRCNRDCKKCDLLLPTEDVLTAYDMAIKALEQEPCETQMIDKSNFSQEQYKADLQSAYDCGKASVKPCEDTISRQAAIDAIMG